MQTDTSLQMVAIAKRIAEANGVSVSEVLAKFSRGVRKTALTREDFFWGDSDISLPKKKRYRVMTAYGVTTHCRAATR